MAKLTKKVLLVRIERNEKRLSNLIHNMYNNATIECVDRNAALCIKDAILDLREAREKLLGRV